MDVQHESTASRVQVDTTHPVSSSPLVSAVRLFTLLGLTLPLLAHASCQVDTVELPVRMVGSRAVATVGINGASVPLTVDSGAFFSMLTEATAAQLKLRSRPVSTLRVEGLTGKVDAQMTTVERLRLFKSDFNHVQFLVGGNEPGAGTAGLMGRNILALGDTEYDLAHGVIRFQFPNDDCADSMMAYWAGSTPVTEVDIIANHVAKVPAIRTHVRLNGKDFIAMFDSGASTVVSAGAARRAGVADADRRPAGRAYGAGRGNAELWTAPFEKFEIGGEAISHNRLLVADFDMDDADLLLGIDFFLSHRIYVSKQQSKVFLTYNGGPVFALDRDPSSATAAAAVPTPPTTPTMPTTPTPPTTPTMPPGADAKAAAGGDETLTADQLARRGAASAARRDYPSALADLERACALEPTSAIYLVQRAGIEEAMKRPEKALADLDRALTLDPKLTGAHLRRAGMRLAAKDRDGANADLDALDRLLAPEAQIRLAGAQLYLRSDQPAKAVAEYDQWLPAHRNEVTRHEALNGRCWARTLLGIDLDRAIDDCDDALDGDPNNWAYLDSRGWAYLRLGRTQKALADFDRSLELHAASAASLYGRGLAKTRLGDAVRGDDDLAAARKLQADIDGRLSRLGLVPAAKAAP